MKSTVLIDTNVILDFLLHREPFYNDANAIMTLCARRDVYGYVAFHSVSNLFYIMRKYIDEPRRRQLLKNLCNILTIAVANHAEVQKAIESY
ncbi:MAG: PIN domain-containing protein [Proteobacteria bacterium]|nr:PIN domain-containing protein [Pseudomonadota bacterium]